MSFKDFLYMICTLLVSSVLATIIGLVAMEQFRYKDWLSPLSGFSDQIGFVFGFAAFYYSFKFLKNDVLGFKFVSERPQQD